MSLAKAPERELVSPCCGAVVVMDGTYNCTGANCVGYYETLAELVPSGRTRDRQHDVGGFPSKPMDFR